MTVDYYEVCHCDNCSGKLEVGSWKKEGEQPHEHEVLELADLQLINS